MFTLTKLETKNVNQKNKYEIKHNKQINLKKKKKKKDIKVRVQAYP